MTIETSRTIVLRTLGLCLVVAAVLSVAARPGHAAELNTTNNTCAVSLHVGAPYVDGLDLIIEGLFPPQHHLSSPSGTWPLSYGIRNVGRDGSTNPSTTRAYLSRDERLSAEDRMIGEDDVPGMAEGVLARRSMTVSIPSGFTDGYMWLIVTADTNDEVNEINEQNNAARVSVHIGTPANLGADLIVEDLASSRYYVDSDSEEWSVSYDVRNIGNGVAAGSGPVRVYLSPDADVSLDDLLIAVDTHGAVNVGESTSRTTALNIPSGYATGYYYVIVAVGDSGVNETPDLVVIDPEVSNNAPEIGEPFTVRATVFNQGNAVSTGTNLRYLRSLDASISPLDTEVGDDYVTPLGPGGSSPESASVRIQTQGIYWMGACVAPVALEWSSSNNCSTGVRITVGGGGGQCAATRSMPGYLEERPALITIVVEPPAGTSSWAVSELPPAGWAVSAISHGGSVAGRNVMFGPFTDADPRTLTYEVTAPAGTTESHVFDGTAAFDGMTEPICGDTDISALSGTYHPADSDSNWMMDGGEAAAYVASWKAGSDWPWPPNPIPIDHVSNAGFLWKSDEAYLYEPSASPPWVPGDGQQPGGSGAGVANLEPSAYSPGEAVTVSISVTLDGAISNYAVQDVPPTDWTISAISSAGQWDVANHTVKWGPFFDNETRTLSYTATPPVGESEMRSFVGVVSTDGVSVAIAGDRSIHLEGSGPPDEDFIYWLDSAAHLPGLLGSQWRTDVVARNPGAEDAAVEFKLHSADGVMGVSTTVGAGDQGVFIDIVGLLEYQGKGALEVIADGPIQVSGRIYNEADQGTYGQYVEGSRPEDGLGLGETGTLLQLRQQEGLYRTNISVVNTGSEEAVVRIRLYDSDGTRLTQYTLSPAPGRLIQDPEPFKRRAEAPDLGWGFATVEVVSGSAILASASVIDSRTNDATTIPFKR